VNFNLNKGGEAIGLFAADGTQIDAVTFGAQTSDVSEGRCPDGTASIVFLPTPTPRAANICPSGNTAPVLAPIGNKFVHQGQTLSFTAGATDADVPSQTLTFGLDGGAPAAAHINGSSGLFTWPTVGVPAPSTNLMTVRVTDNGTPSLDDSELIAVVVLAPLNFSQLNRTGNQLTFGWQAAPNQTYRVEYKDDLSAGGAWTTLPGSENLSTVGGSLSVTVDVTDPPHPLHNRFYRVELVQ
jgi:hypothetical protein